MNDIKIGRAMHDDVTHLPPSLVIDIDAAMAEGGRRIRRKAVASRAVAAALVLAVPAAGVAMTRLRDSQPPLIGTPLIVASNAPSRSPAPLTAPARFDPLRKRLQAGWVPADVPDRREEMSATEQTLSFSKPPAKDGFPIHDATASIYAAGVKPHRIEFVTGPPGRPGLEPIKPVPGPSIGGRPGQWYGASTIVWQWAPNAWALVSVSGYGSVANDRAAATRFAQGLRMDGDEPVRLPLRMPAPPQPLRLVSTHVMWSRGEVEAHLTFSDRDDETDPKTRIPRLLLVVLKPAEQRGQAGGKPVPLPNTSIDGHPAYVEFDAESGVAEVVNIAGLDRKVHVYDPATRRYVNRATAERLAAGIQAITDPEQWTTDPIL